MRLPDPEEHPTMGLWPEVGQALGLSRNAAYDQAQLYERTNGARGIPVLRFGTRYRVPTAALRQMLGIDPAPAGAGPASTDNEVERLRLVTGGG